MKEKATLVLIYNSFMDPLFQNLMLEYIKTLSQNRGISFHLITFEQDRYDISVEDKRKIKLELLKYRIQWHPLKFHTGRALLLNKLWDFMQSFYKIIQVRIKYNTSIILAFANLSAAISIIFKRLLRVKLIIYSYEPHSDFMADFGYWSRSGMKYKLLYRLETAAGKGADYILTGTQYMVDHLVSKGVKAEVFRAPTAVNSEHFYFDSEQRQILREENKWADRPVFIYVGKFGGLYYDLEIPEFLNKIKQHMKDAFFIVLTPNNNEEIQGRFLRFLSKEDFFIYYTKTQAETRAYLSCADMGISGIPPAPSQKYRSPTKVAEYLLCGLPYITAEGVSEDDLYARNEDVGVVVSSFNVEPSKQVLHEISRLLGESADDLRERCRRVGLNYRSKDRVDEVLNQIYRKI